MWPTELSANTVKARKDHWCMLCGQIAVHKGEVYMRRSYAFDGSVYTWVNCVPCTDVISMAIGRGYEDDGGVSTDIADEWAMDYFMESPAALDYLKRRGWTNEDLEDIEEDRKARQTGAWMN